MSIKVKQALVRCFSQIKDKSFDEDTIRLLLISSREFLDKESILHELANFIAHPIREAGIFHTTSNVRYAKFKLFNTQVRKLDTETRPSFANDQEVNDFLLSGVGIDEIDAELFDLIYFKGLNDVSDELLFQYTKLNREEALSTLKTYYKKRNGIYYLNRNVIEKAAYDIYLKVMSLGNVTGKPLMNLIDFKKSEFGDVQTKYLIAQIDNLQKTIRGCIPFSTIIPEQLSDELVTSLKKIIQHFELTGEFDNAVEKNKDDILLCILTLMHDTQFQFYDNTAARTFLTFYWDLPGNDYNLSAQTYEVALIALYMKHPQFGSFPLIISDLKVSQYFDLQQLSGTDDVHSMDEIPWTTATRINADLKLSLTV